MPDVGEKNLPALFARCISADQVQKTSRQCQVDVKQEMGIWFRDGPQDASPEEIRNFLSVFRNKITDYNSAGNITSFFSRVVLSVIESDKVLSKSQKRLIEGLCSAINVRPLPTILWADFVRSYSDNPNFISRVLTACLKNKQKLEARIQRRISNYVCSLQLDWGRPIMAFGYSATVVAALRGIQKITPIPLNIETPKLARPGRGTPDGIALRNELHGNGFNVKVMEDDVALEEVRKGVPSLLLMGCKAVGLRRTDELEIVGSTGALEFAQESRYAEVPVWIIAGFYKLFATPIYERHRPHIILEQHGRKLINSIIPADYCQTFVTEDGVFSVEQFLEGYSTFFTKEAVPAPAIRECYGRKGANLKYMEEQIKRLFEGLEDNEGDGLVRRRSSAGFDFAGRPLPSHYINAKRYYERKLQRDEEFLKDNLGKYVAIVGKQVVDSDTDLGDLILRTQKKYGYGPIFIPLVTREPEVAYLTPKGRVEEYKAHEGRYG